MPVNGPSTNHVEIAEPAVGGGAKPLLRVAAPLRQELINQIRASILMFEYRPGSRLVERSLCDKYGVSRTVVRESLRQLEAEGLVTIVPNRGPVVTVLSREDAVALFEVRGDLEALAARLFAQRASEAEKRRLEATVDEVETAFAAGDLQVALTAKDAFYEALCAGAHNEIMTGILVGLHARVQLLRGVSLRAPGRQPETMKEIRRICECAVAGDAEGAAAAAAFHVEQAAAVALSQMAEHVPGV
jgi:DNA-binding GntR family transcriptional regulator